LSFSVLLTLRSVGQTLPTLALPGTNLGAPWDKLRRSLGLTQALPKKSNFVPGRSALSPFHRGGVSREISRWTRVHQPVNPGADTIKLFTAVIYERA